LRIQQPVLALDEKGIYPKHPATERNSVAATGESNGSRRLKDAHFLSRLQASFPSTVLVNFPFCAVHDRATKDTNSRKQNRTVLGRFFRTDFENTANQTHRIEQDRNATANRVINVQSQDANDAAGAVQKTKYCLIRYITVKPSSSINFADAIVPGLRSRASAVNMLFDPPSLPGAAYPSRGAMTISHFLPMYFP
jgi:hypothetical protein